jgi:hypothetical protein
MPKTSDLHPSVKRYRDFRHALIDEQLTATAFAASLGVSRIHIVRSFREPANCAKRIHDAIDALLAKHARPSVAA